MRPGKAPELWRAQLRFLSPKGHADAWFDFRFLADASGFQLLARLAPPVARPAHTVQLEFL